MQLTDLLLARVHLYLHLRQLVLQVFQHVFKIVDPVCQFLILVYLFMDGLVEFPVQFHDSVQFLAAFLHPQIVLVDFVELVLQEFVLGFELFDLQGRALAFLSFFLVLQEQLVLFLSQLAVVLLQMLFVSLKVQQFLDALVFLLKIPPQLDQLALVLLIFPQ